MKKYIHFVSPFLLKRIWLLILLNVIVIFLDLLLIFIFSLFVSSYLIKNDDFLNNFFLRSTTVSSEIASLCLLLFGLARWYVSLALTKYQNKIVFSNDAWLREKIVSHMNQIQFSGYSSFNKSKWNNIIVDQVSQFSYGIFVQLINIFSELLALFSIFFLVVYFWGIYPLFVYIILGVTVYYFNRYNKLRTNKIGENKTNALKDLYLISNDYHEEYFKYNFTRRLTVLYDRFRSSSSLLGHNQSQYIISSLNPRYFSEVIMSIFFTLLVILGKYELITESGILVSVLSLYRILPSMNRILVAGNQLNFSSGVVNDLIIFFDLNTNFSIDNDLSCLSKFEELQFKKLNFLSDNVFFEHSPLIIRPKDIILIKGKSGSGKSTLLKLLAGIHVLKKGEIKINNNDIDSGFTSIMKDIGFFVNQSSSISKYSLMNNILKDCKNITLLETLIEGLDLYFYLDRLNFKGTRDFSFSGGEIQRLTVAQAFITERKVIFLDEPSSALDEKTKMKMVNLFQELSERFSYTIVFVSHDNCFDKIATKTINI